jgi:hypothetical protein
MLQSCGSQSGLYRPWGAVELHRGICGKGRKEAPEVGPSERVAPVFTIEQTPDQTWCHFIKPTHRIKNLLRVK